MGESGQSPSCFDVGSSFVAGRGEVRLRSMLTPFSRRQMAKKNKAATTRAVTRLLEARVWKHLNLMVMTPACWRSEADGYSARDGEGRAEGWVLAVVQCDGSSW